MKWIDSHAHLDDRAFDSDRASVIARCAETGMGILSIGASLRSSHAAVRLARRYRNMWATVGVHPHGAKSVTAGVMAEIEMLAADSLVVGIGEIGLDYYRDLSPRECQREVFAQQLDLAARLKLPVSLHNRESTDDFLAILKNRGTSHGGVVHSFLGDRALADEFLSLGLHLGVGGPLTYPKNRMLREAIQGVPLDRILLETDCPYLTPVPYRGRRNEPMYVQYVAEEIANLKGIDIGVVAEQTTQNVIHVFGLSS